MLVFSKADLAQAEMLENEEAGSINVSACWIICSVIFMYLIFLLHFRWKVSVPDTLSTKKCRDLTILLLMAHTAMAAGKDSEPKYFKVAGVNAPDSWESWLAKKVARKMVASATQDLEQTMYQFRPDTPSSSATDLSSATTLIVIAGVLLYLLTSRRPVSRDMAPSCPSPAPKDVKGAATHPLMRTKAQSRPRTGSPTWAYLIFLITTTTLILNTEAKVRTRNSKERNLLSVPQAGVCTEVRGNVVYAVLDNSTGEKDSNRFYFNWEAEISLRICGRDFRLDMIDVFEPDVALSDRMQF